MATKKELLEELGKLRDRLEEEEETLRAIGHGEVDALVISGPEGERVYTLKGADHSYRILVETINEGAATLTPDGVIFYANRKLAQMLRIPLERLVTSNIGNYIAPPDREWFEAMLSRGKQGDSRGEVLLQAADGSRVLAFLSFSSLRLEGLPETVCLAATDLTEQKRQEEILAEGRLSRAILEQVEHAIVVCDADGLITQASRAAHSLLGGNPLLRPFQEALPLSITNDSSPPGIPLTQAFSLTGVLGGMVHRNLEATLQMSDGRCFFVLLDAGPLYGDNGVIRGCIVSLTDITARKQQEVELQRLLKEQQVLTEELRDSKERYRRLVELSPDAILVHDGDRYVFANPAAARLFGSTTPEELRGKPVLHLVPPRHRHEVRERMQKSLQGEATKLREFQILNLDGRPVDVEVAGVGITYQGKPAVQIVMREITARKGAEEELKAAHYKALSEKNRLEAVMEALPVGVAILDAQGGHIHSNSRFEHIWGAGRPLPQEVSDYSDYKAWWVDTGKPVQPEEWASTLAIRQGEAVISQVMKIATFDGKKRFVINSAAPIMDAEGKVTECAVAILDITELRRAEESLRERTAELELANRDLETFAYSVSHDLKTPVRAIQGFSRMLMEGHADKLDAEGLRLLKVVCNNTGLMEHLIDDLLALSRLGRQHIRKSVVNLTALTRQVFEKFRAQNPQRRLELTVGDLPPCFCDHSLFYQVMENLLANAIKFTKSRETAVIEVGGRTEGQKNIYYVKDNGVGFDEDYTHKLFGVFQTLHRRKDYEGTGVGLAIVKRIVQKHGGRVWAEGKLNEGATFYFALPQNGE